MVDPYVLKLTLFSISILALTRVLATFYYEANDYMKQSALVALITGLEPILGVINACLPFLPSVLKHVGQTNVFIRASIILKSTAGKFLKGKVNAATGSIGAQHSGQFKELTDIEMNPLKGASFGRTNVGTGSLNSMREDGQWDDLPGRELVGEQQVDQEGGCFRSLGIDIALHLLLLHNLYTTAST